MITTVQAFSTASKNIKACSHMFVYAINDDDDHESSSSSNNAPTKLLVQEQQSPGT